MVDMQLREYFARVKPFRLKKIHKKAIYYLKKNSFRSWDANHA